MRFRFTLSNVTQGNLVLEKNPVGWETMEILIQRGLETHGFFYEQTVELAFYCGAGKEYIDNIRELEGIDAEISIIIDVACGCDPGTSTTGDYSVDYSIDYNVEGSAEGDCQWEEFYTGILDMKTWKSEKNFTNVEIIESSFFRTVRNRMETLVDFMATESIGGVELDPFTFGPYDLNLHSKAILLVSEIEMILSSYQEDIIPDPSGSDTLYFTLPFNFIPLQEITQVEIPSPPLLYQQSSAPQRKRIYVNDTGSDITVDLSYNLQGTIKEFFNRDRNYNLGIVYAVSGTDDPGVGGASFIVDYGPISTFASVVMNQPVSETGTLTSLYIPAGQSVYIYLVFANYSGQDSGSPSTTTLGFFDNVESSVSIENVSITDDSTGKAFVRFEAGAKICQVISDREDAFRSTYFGRTNSEPFAYDDNGYGSFASILSGFWIRGFPLDGDFARTTKMSLGDYYRSNSAIENLGLGIENIDGTNYVVIERMDHFYDSTTTLLTFNNVPNLVISEAPEYYFGRVNIGYNKWTTEFRNGLEEPNSTRSYDLGIKSVENSKEIFSNLVAGGYRIEQARRMQFVDSATTDTDGDEDNHIVYLNRTTVDNIPTMLDVAEKDENFDSVTNLLSPETAYNLRGSVARNYLRHNDIINPALLKYPGRNAKFMAGEGNYKMTSDFTSDNGPGRWNNESLSEGQNIQWDDTNNTDNNPIWIPEIATFKFPLSFTDFKVLKNNPKGVILVSETSEYHIPYYLLEVKYVPGNGGLADFKLLRAYQ